MQQDQPSVVGLVERPPVNLARPDVKHAAGFKRDRFEVDLMPPSTFSTPDEQLKLEPLKPPQIATSPSLQARQGERLDRQTRCSRPVGDLTNINRRCLVLVSPMSDFGIPFVQFSGLNHSQTTGPEMA